MLQSNAMLMLELNFIVLYELYQLVIFHGCPVSSSHITQRSDLLQTRGSRLNPSIRIGFKERINPLFLDTYAVRTGYNLSLFVQSFKEKKPYLSFNLAALGWVKQLFV